MIEKTIDFNGYNRVIVKSIYDNGEYLTDLFQDEVRKDENISFAADNQYFSLTGEEIEVLRTIIKQD